MWKSFPLQVGGLQRQLRSGCHMGQKLRVYLAPNPLAEQQGHVHAGGAAGGETLTPALRRQRSPRGCLSSPVPRINNSGCPLQQDTHLGASASSRGSDTASRFDVCH